MTNLILILIIFLQSFLIIHPMLKRKFFHNNEKMINKNQTITINRDLVLKSSIKMVKSKKIVMSFNDEESLYVVLSGVKNKILFKNPNKNYAYFNFPLAFLLNGLIDYYISFQDGAVLIEVQKKCETLVDQTGRLKFNIDKLDQAYFGLVFLKLYKITENFSYLLAAEQIFNDIQKFKSKTGLYNYRKDLEVFFIDSVGLVCPFLVEYAKFTDDKSIMDEAEIQVKFALENCIENDLGFTFHAVDLRNNQKLGSVNWSRGMGWFLLGLSSIAKEGNNIRFLDILKQYKDLLNKFKEKHGFWAQFLGHNDDSSIDSSATLMFTYAFKSCNAILEDHISVQDLCEKCLDQHGNVLYSSGDTIYMNKYSKVKGQSELSQGLMLSILAGVLE